MLTVMTDAQHKRYQIKLHAEIIEYLEENGETTVHDICTVEGSPLKDVIVNEAIGHLNELIKLGVVKEREVKTEGHSMYIYDIDEGESVNTEMKINKYEGICGDPDIKD